MSDEKAFVWPTSNQGTFDIKAGMPPLTPSLWARGRIGKQCVSADELVLKD